ncbi:Hypothetical predicted protein [Paramuricea clavata]|uniref:Uncharacterized protein n=1 Tax=Paramuricea clavata TaxID=317549 RepID=A0A7D9K2K0_PARCT|nr:Hypothetical predicted protein [Paramuricea clavata]
MTTSEFMTKVAKIFNVRKDLICITYKLPSSIDDEQVTVEIEERDPNSLQHAINVLKDYSKLTIEVKLQPNTIDLQVMDGKRVLRTKEVITEEIKRNMGLHSDTEKRTRGFVDAKWTEQCSQLLSEDSRYLLQFDKLKAGAKLIFGNDGYILNPVQVICPVCLEIKILSSMNQLRSLSQHFKEVHFHDPRGISIIKRLNAWMENNFISAEQLDQEAPLPDGLVSPQEMLLTPPRVRAVVLARDIS